MRPNPAKFGLKGINAGKRLHMLWLADRVLRAMFHMYARTIGLYHYHLPDMDEIARVAHEHYNNHLRGGEGHMEVGKLIQNVKKRKVNMAISVKLFGCTPSSGVSDGVQSLITEKSPTLFSCRLKRRGTERSTFPAGCR